MLSEIIDRPHLLCCLWRVPLDPLEGFIRNLSAVLDGVDLMSDFDIEPPLLEAIKTASNAKIVFVMTQSKETWVLKGKSSFLKSEIDENAYIKILVSSIGPYISNIDTIIGDQHGLYKINENDNTLFDNYTLNRRRRSLADGNWRP